MNNQEPKDISINESSNQESKDIDIFDEIKNKNDNFQEDKLEVEEEKKNKDKSSKSDSKIDNKEEAKEEEDKKDDENNKKAAKENIKDDEKDKKQNNIESIKRELEKSNKRVEDTKRWGNKHAQKNKEAVKLTNQLIEEGYLSQDEASPLLKILSSDDINEKELEEIEHNSLPPIKRIYSIANKELDNMRKYLDDEFLDKKINSFDYLINNSEIEDVNEIIEKLEELNSDPVKMTKEMLRMGEKYYEEVYKDIEESGGIKKYINIQKENIEKLEKKIDKLNKKLQQYEDYSENPKYNLEEISENRNEEDSDFGDMFDVAKKAKENSYLSRMSVSRRR